ncbi:hypothetical protein E2605_18460 [Dysgonomonas capnocytophagoides]|uniref:Uncharacterized protein n=1 Tax=Dysgonomonas capnocytophagoides TaxID=45254 RepID=A0A4Y8KV51_9BACT|nr:hypothetical protein [Dysgonomonas capnocytophagoides]TFD92822.1 hypothetical protein E2605_18460 [Dysgonomonas capnocytophagoides]
MLKLTFTPTSNNFKQVKSQIYFVPKSKEGLGIDSMGEFAISFEYSGQFVNEKGQPVPFIHIAQTLEIAFNFQFGNAYKSKARVFSRKPYNLTKAFDYLKKMIISVSRTDKMKKDAFSGS